MKSIYNFPVDWKMIVKIKFLFGKKTCIWSKAIV